MHRFASGRKLSFSLALCVAAVWSGSAAIAQPSPDSPGHDAMRKHSEYRKKWPQASLQAQATAEVAHDTVRITLAVEIADAAQDVVAQELTRVLNRTMERARDKAGDVKVQSGDYRVWPMNDKDGQISNWRGRTEISLESTDFSAASDLAAALTDVMAISSVTFSVSPQTRALHEQRLLDDAAQAFRARAQALATALGFAGYTLRTIDLGGSGAQYEMAPRGGMAHAAMLKATDSSIPLEAGSETISVSIHGSVFLIDELE